MCVRGRGEASCHHLLPLGAVVVFQAVASYGLSPVVRRFVPGQLDAGLADGRRAQVPRGARRAIGRRARLAGEGAFAVGVDSRHPVAAPRTRRQTRVLVFPGRGGGVTHQRLPVRAIVGGMFYVVAGDGRSPVAGRVPFQRNCVLALGRGAQVHGRARNGLGRRARLAREQTCSVPDSPPPSCGATAKARPA